ncbi:MAG: energy-coupling factor ABC transporter permease, partial [Gammaproteobacteria bacterium]
MQIDAELLSPGWLWACRVAATIAVALAARRLDWKALLQDAPTLHRFAACTVGLLVLWSIRATVAQGPGLHILGVTTVTLVLGPASAMIATLIAEAVTGLTMKTESALAASWLAGSVLPVVATDGIRRLVRRMLPHDPFSFIFGCGFFGAAAATVAAHIGAYLMV